jgi:hypothetical protein
MQLVALSPVHVAQVVWRRDPRTSVMTVVCKATFDLIPGEMRLASQQEPIHEREQRWEDDPARSVHAPSDLAPFKPRADVTLVGTAYAPQGKALRSLTARLVCGTIDKAIAVYGDRPRPGHPEPASFTRMPLRYERASGGPGTSNPVGTPERAPNLEPPRRGDGPTTPIGFGPVAPDWPERTALLRSYAGWSPDEPFPEDFDGGYFNVAPVDQQIPSLRNDQPIHLENLHPDHARLSTRLPGLHPQAFVERPGAAQQELEMRPDAIWIDTDRARCTVTWRAQLALSQPDEPGRVLIAMVGARQQLGWGDVARLDEALHGGQPSQRAPARPPAESVTAVRSRPDVPSIVHDDEEEDDNYTTTVAAAVVKPHSLLRVGTPTPPPPAPQPAPAAAPIKAPLPIIPAQPPIPKRTATLQGQPFRKPATQEAPIAPPPAPPPPPPAPPRHPEIEVEATHTDLFVLNENTPIFDNAPAWLAAVQPAPPLAPAPAPQTPAPPPPAAPAPPPSLTEPPAPADLLREASGPASRAPAEPVSPWAAAASSAPISVTAPPVAAPPVAAPADARSTAPVVAAAAPRRDDEIIDLLWFDPESLPRVRARWPKIIEELEFEPLNPRRDLPVDDPVGSRDRHHAFGVLTRAEATDVRGVSREVLEAIDEHGQFTAPLVVIGGELRLPFDEIETLKTAAAAAKPLAKDDKKLTDLLEMVGELLDTPLLQGSPSAVDSLLRDLTSAVQQARRTLPVKYLDAHIERVLLEKRRYQRRTVFGGTSLRALLGKDGVPTYLPEDLATKLPLVTQMKARLIAEVTASQDQYESHPHALRVVALGRVMTLR